MGLDLLFAKWRGIITLPAIPVRRRRVGNNLVTQSLFLGISCNAEIFDGDVPGHDLIRTDLTAPYREILLRRKGARRRSDPAPVVTCALTGEVKDWPNDIKVAWDGLGRLETYCDTPDKVLDAWVNEFAFREEDEGTGATGLRRPQIGALHAISAHFAVGEEFEPATVVLPTGTGKTETMLAAMVYRRLRRALVLVPSDALRTQISAKFASLGVLPACTVVRGGDPSPSRGGNLGRHPLGC